MGAAIRTPDPLRPRHGSAYLNGPTNHKITKELYRERLHAQTSHVARIEAAQFLKIQQAKAENLLRDLDEHPANAFRPLETRDSLVAGRLASLPKQIGLLTIPEIGTCRRLALKLAADSQGRSQWILGQLLHRYEASRCSCVEIGYQRGAKACRKRFTGGPDQPAFELDG